MFKRVAWVETKQGSLRRMVAVEKSIENVTSKLNHRIQIKGMTLKNFRTTENMSMPGGSAMPQANQAEAQEQARKQAENQENAKNTMLSQILDQQALVRLSNLAAAKPEKAQMVEAALINMARRGQIAGKMNDESLKQFMERVAQQTQRSTTVKFDRRRNNLDSDDEDY
ncbi:unnamed protein product [Caenorhabditis bovis]|uniref:Programmed cell death protein 5 n=1 Tax=Caenorhabditis bovis TaxID=2654633 RepID=A0A8S1F9K6_9PELO|nr:unnamed protein product [Caenorhabditis bovis]